MAQLWTFYIVAPIGILDKPVGGDDMTIFTDFIKYDTDGITPIGRYSMHEYCDEGNTNRKLLYASDSEYAYFGWNLSDLNNNMSDIKALMAYYGYVAGGKDFTNDDRNAFWILNADEILEWLDTSPHNVAEAKDIV